MLIRKEIGMNKHYLLTQKKHIHTGLDAKIDILKTDIGIEEVMKVF